MPLVNPSASAPPVEKPTTVQITAPEYKGVTVDTRRTPLPEITVYIEGSSWTVNYYSQVLDKDTNISGLKPNLDPQYQQYRVISEMELKVTSPLQTSQDPNTNAMIITGTASVYSFLIPNVGDIFLADIGDGREGLFQLTNVERKSLFKDATHVVEYQLIKYTDADIKAELNAKVVKVVKFIKDFLIHGQNPLLVPDDYEILLDLQGRFKEITDRYFKSFTSEEYRTVIVPGQQYRIYDHFLVTMLLSVFSAFDTPQVRGVRRLNCDDDLALKSTNIWNALQNQDDSLVKYCSKHAGLVSARSFEKNPMMESIYHSGMQFIVYPKDPDLSVDYQMLSNTKPLALEHLVDQESPLKNVEVPDLTALSYTDAPAINPVLVDDYYVFSEAFYTKAQTGQSKLELLVWDYLTGKELDKRLLLGLCQSQHTWGALERFYYVPVLLILVRAAIRSI